MKNTFFLTLLILIKSFVFSQTQHPKDIDQVLRIPVVFHVVGNNVSERVVPFSYAKTVLKKLNDDFNNVDISKIEQEYRSLIANCKIVFYFSSDVIPVSYHNTYISKTYSFRSSHDLGYISSFGYLNSKKFINIWIAKFTEHKAEYNIFVNDNFISHEGIIIDSSLFLNDKVSFALGHELGHCFGLKHIWGGSLFDVYDATSNCVFDDDILDTPMQKSKNTEEDISNSVFQSICVNDNVNYGKYSKSNYQNFMDYSYNVGMFTKGQKTKMRYNILEYRSDLIEQSPINNPNDRKKIVIENEYINKLEFRITSLDGSGYKSTFYDNYINILQGRYLFEINDYKTKKGIANNIFNIKSNNKGIFVNINKYGCTKWKYIGGSSLNELSFNINKLEGKCNNYSNTSSRNTRNTRYKSHKRKSGNSNKRKSSGNKSYDDAYKRSQKMYNKGYKRANDMYNKARKKHR